jgi:hypothetical protein
VPTAQKVGGSNPFGRARLDVTGPQLVWFGVRRLNVVMNVVLK